MRLIAERGLPRVGVDDSDISTAEVVGQTAPMRDFLIRRSRRCRQLHKLARVS
jgi:hypothetical protein